MFCGFDCQKSLIAFVARTKGRQPMNSSLKETIVELETSLFRESVRKSEPALNRLLHDAFEEIGASGQTYNKGEIIDALLKEDFQAIEAEQFELDKLANDTVQLTYTAKKVKNGVTQTTLRSSLWKKDGDEWRLLFHQGSEI